MKVISKISFIIIFSCIISLPLNSFARVVVDGGGGGGSGASVVDTYINNIKGEDPSDSELDTGTITRIVSKILGFLQVASACLTVITVASTGFRYIVETPEVKGDLRKNLLPLIMGLILVFLAVTIAKFVIGIGSSVEKTGT